MGLDAFQFKCGTTLDSLRQKRACCNSITVVRMLHMHRLV